MKKIVVDLKNYNIDRENNILYNYEYKNNKLVPRKTKGFSFENEGYQVEVTYSNSKKITDINNLFVFEDGYDQKYIDKYFKIYYDYLDSIPRLYYLAEKSKKALGQILYEQVKKYLEKEGLNVSESNCFIKNNWHEYDLLILKKHTRGNKTFYDKSEVLATVELKASGASYSQAKSFTKYMLEEIDAGIPHIYFSLFASLADYNRIKEETFDINNNITKVLSYKELEDLRNLESLKENKDKIKLYPIILTTKAKTIKFDVTSKDFYDIDSVIEKIR